MKITALKIVNFKSIVEMTITDIDQTLILVGKNNTGKSSILSAIRALSPDYQISPFDYNQRNKSIEIHMTLEVSDEDLKEFHQVGKVSKFRNYDKWFEDFKRKLPSFSSHSIQILCKITIDGERKYSDGLQKTNPYIHQIVPSLYVVDEYRSFESLNTFLDLQGFSALAEVKNNLCIFDQTRKCNDCFNCIPVIHKKTPEEMTLYESLILVKFKLYSANIQKYEDGINKYFKSSYGEQYEIQYKFNFNIESLLKIDTFAKNLENQNHVPIKEASTSMKSLYILSLFQAYLEAESKISSVIIVDQPELHLHPELQKVTSEILYKLSKKNQVIFTTHSPSMLFNFSAKQIRQVILNQEHHTAIKEQTNLDAILEDLGYTANDLMNVNFAFIVEGKEDSSRLPLLLDRYYTEMRDASENLVRIAIIQTNSCTNIRTYANLKFMNQTYLKDNFLMVRDGDGKDPELLTEQLCSYYFKRMHDDDAKIPRITPKNVLILKYYSFENYFLNPSIMKALGVLSTEEEFYTILFSKWQQYLSNLKSAKNMFEKTGLKIHSLTDLKNNMETFKIYMRGHNLFDIFYGKYKRGYEQTEILKKYVGLAPRDEFKDILESIDRFIYFDNRKK